MVKNSLTANLLIYSKTCLSSFDNNNTDKEEQINSAIRNVININKLWNFNHFYFVQINGQGNL